MTRPCTTNERRRPWLYRLMLVLALGTLGCGASTPTSKASEPEAPAPPPSPGSPSAPASSCPAVHELGGYCFPSVEAACRALPCSDKGCSIGYSLPPVVACAAPGEAVVLPDAN